MSQKSQDAIDVLSKVIVDTIDKKLDTANFDKSQTGVVTAVNGNTYTIAVFGSQYNITSDQIFTVGQSVVVTALQGDMKRLVCSPDNVGTMKTVDSKVKVVGDQLSSFIDKDFADTVIRYTDVGKFFNIKLAKPIISKFSVIDAAQKNTVRYTCYDDTVNEVEYVVCDNASGNIIIDQKVQTSGASSIRTFTLPAGLVHNRLLPYYLKIAVKNQSGKQSDLSDAVLFYCHEKPVLKFTDVDSTTVTTIPFPAFSFNVQYKNIEDHGETLSLYKYQLYDGDKNLLYEETHYGTIAHSFNVESLDNNKVYYVRATGETVNGYLLDTGFCAFRIAYNGQLQNLEIVAKNEKREGKIKLSITITTEMRDNFDLIRVKRREVGKYEWTTIYERSIKNIIGSISFVCHDKYARGRKTMYQYAAVPVVDDIEQLSASVNVVSEFEGAWLMDKDTSYYVGLEPKVTGVTRNQEAAVETTLSSKYPIVFYGSEANYYNGNFSGVIIKWDQSTDMFDFDGSVDYRETFIDWLTNKKPKVLKMYDGRAWLINVNGNVSYSDDEHPDKVEISFDFIETGDLNSSSDMKNAGLI